MNDDKIFNVGNVVQEGIDSSRKLQEGVIIANWEKIVKRMARDSQPIFLKDGILRINVKSPIFHQAFVNKKQEVIDRINENFNKIVVTDLDIRLEKVEKIDIEVKDHEVEEVEEKESVIEKMNSTSEEGIIEKVQYLRKIAEEREKYLLSQGYKKCKICGMIFKPENNSEFCKVCIIQKKTREYKEN